MNLFSKAGLVLAGFAVLFGAGFGFFKPHDRRLLQGSLTLGLAAWLLFVFSITLNGPYAFDTFRSANGIPLAWVGEIVRENQSSGLNSITVRLIFKQLFANGLMFVPGGFLMAWLKPSFRNGTRIAVSAAGCSLFIETIQFFIGRIADIDDVLMNSLGALVGFMLFQFGFRLVSSLCKDDGVIANKRERRRIGN